VRFGLDQPQALIIFCNKMFSSNTSSVTNYGSQYIAVGHYNSPYLTVYSWNENGFNGKIPNPTTLSPGNIGLFRGVVVTELNGSSSTTDGNAIGITNQTSSPYITVWPFSKAGFGTKFSDPATGLPGLGLGGNFSKRYSDSMQYLAVGSDTSPYITVWEFDSSSSGGFGTKLSDPSTLPAGAVRNIVWSPNSTGGYPNALIAAHVTSPRISAWAWSSSGFGTKYSNPSTLPPGNGFGVSITKAGDAVIVSHPGSPYITAYPWDDTTGFGTKYSNPSVLPPSQGNGVTFSPADNAVICTNTATPYVAAYEWSSSTGFGNKFSDPSTSLTDWGYAVDFTADASTVAISSGNSPFVLVFPWSTSGFGTKYANPSILPAGTSRDVRFFSIFD